MQLKVVRHISMLPPLPVGPEAGAEVLTGAGAGRKKMWGNMVRGMNTVFGASAPDLRSAAGTRPPPLSVFNLHLENFSLTYPVFILFYSPGKVAWRISHERKSMLAQPPHFSAPGAYTTDAPRLAIQLFSVFTCFSSRSCTCSHLCNKADCP